MDKATFPYSICCNLRYLVFSLVNGLHLYIGLSLQHSAGTLFNTVQWRNTLRHLTIRVCETQDWVQTGSSISHSFLVLSSLLCPQDITSNKKTTTTKHKNAPAWGSRLWESKRIPNPHQWQHRFQGKWRIFLLGAQKRVFGVFGSHSRTLVMRHPQTLLF